jgi:oligogalacturonide transporter
MDKSKENRLWSKVAYGLTDLYGGGAFLILSILFLVFLTDVVGLPGWLAGIVPLVGKIWDAVTDPIMGNICDRTHSKYGKKRIYLLIGSFTSLLTFVLLFVNVQGNIYLSFVYYLLMYILFSTAFTIVMVPYNALLPDMIEDYKLRTKYTTIRMIFSAISAILGGLVPNFIVNAYAKQGNAPLGYLVMSLAFGVLFLVAILLTFMGSWEKESPVIRIPLKETFSESFSVYKNKSFRRYLGVFLFGQGATDFVTTLAVYFIVVVLHPGSNYYNGTYTLIMGAILVSQLLAMVAFTIFSNKMSKKLPIYLGLPLRIVATAAMVLCLYMNLNVWVVAALSFVAGIGSAGSSVTSYAFLADMSDLDELVTGKRRSGLCSGMATFTRKIAQGIASAICGGILTWCGYDAAIKDLKTTAEIRDFTYSSTVVNTIGYCYIIIPIIFMLLCLLMTYLYGVGAKEFAAVKKELSRRKGETNEPITDEEKAMLEKVTGFAYERLGKEENAHTFGVKAHE